MCGQAVGEARAHTRIHFQTRSFRDHKTQAHWTIITGFTGGWRGPSPTLPRRSSLPFLGSREPSLSYSNVLPFTLLPDLSFSLIFHIRSSSLFSLFALKFVPHPSPVRPLIPNVRTPAYTSLLLTTTLYYWHSRTTTSSGVSTTFRPDLRPANNHEISSRKFSGGRGRKRALRDYAIYARYFLPASSPSYYCSAHRISSCYVSILFISFPNLSIPFSGILSNCRIPSLQIENDG